MLIAGNGYRSTEISSKSNRHRRYVIELSVFFFFRETFYSFFLAESYTSARKREKTPAGLAILARREWFSYLDASCVPPVFPRARWANSPIEFHECTAYSIEERLPGVMISWTCARWTWSTIGANVPRGWSSLNRRVITYPVIRRQDSQQLPELDSRHFVYITVIEVSMNRGKANCDDFVQNF